MTNLPNDTVTYNVFQPRIGGTFTVNPDNVLRFSYGKYTQARTPPISSTTCCSKTSLRTTPQTSGRSGSPPRRTRYGADVEQLRSLVGAPDRDTSFKVTPFLRQTKDQIQNFFLNQKTTSSPDSTPATRPQTAWNSR